MLVIVVLSYMILETLGPCERLYQNYDLMSYRGILRRLTHFLLLMKIISEYFETKCRFYFVSDVLILFYLEFFSVYTYDTRHMRMPVNVHMDHVSAVTSIDYSPTGREFVTGSHDKTIRIFEVAKVN